MALTGLSVVGDGKPRKMVTKEGIWFDGGRGSCNVLCCEWRWLSGGVGVGICVCVCVENGGERGKEVFFFFFDPRVRS